MMTGPISVGLLCLLAIVAIPCGTASAVCDCDAIGEEATIDVSPLEDATASGHAFHTLAQSPIRITITTLDFDDAAHTCTTASGSVSDMLGGTLSCSDDLVFTAAKRNILLNKVFPAAIALMQKHISVSPISSVKVGATSCGFHTKPPASYNGTGVPNTDLLLYASASPIAGTSTWAWAGYCTILSATHQRPIAGRMNFSPKYIAWDDAFPENNRRYIYLVVHEMLHALGFLSAFLESRTLPKIQNNTDYFKTVTTAMSRTKKGWHGPKAVAAARAHHGCDSMAYVDLEDESSSAESHWDRRNMIQDVMSPVVGTRQRMSAITLGLLEDTGYYTTQLPEAMDFGYASGCDFFSGCTTSAQGMGHFWCNDSSTANKHCSHDHQSVGYCSTPGYNMDGCAVVEEFDNRICIHRSLATDALSLDGNTFASNSRCVLSDATFRRSNQSSASSVVGARCVEALCTTASNGALGLQIRPTSNDEWKDCVADGARVTFQNYTGSLVCPAKAAVCVSWETSVWQNGTTPAPPTPIPPTPSPVTPQPPTPLPPTPAPATPQPPSPQPPTPSPPTPQPASTIEPLPTPIPTTPAPPTPAPTAPGVTVVMVLAVTVDQFNATEFRNDVAAEVGVSTDRIEIRNVRSSSVQLDVYIAASTAGGGAGSGASAQALAAQLENASQQSSSALNQKYAVVSAVVATPAPTPVPPPPPTPPPPTIAGDNGGDGNNVVVIAAAAAGGGAVLIGLVVGVVCFVRWRRSSRARTKRSEPTHVTRRPAAQPRRHEAASALVVQAPNPVEATVVVDVGDGTPVESPPGTP